MGCIEPTGLQSLPPLPLAWLLQPVVGVDSYAVTVAAVLVLNVSVVVFLFFALRALRVRDWQMAILLVLITLAFEPTTANIVEGQITLVLLALSAVCLLSLIYDRCCRPVPLAPPPPFNLIYAPFRLLI